MFCLRTCIKMSRMKVRDNVPHFISSTAHPIDVAEIVIPRISINGCPAISLNGIGSIQINQTNSANKRYSDMDAIKNTNTFFIA